MTYRFDEVRKLSGASRSQLIHWTNIDVIEARAGETEGTGHHRRFDFRNLVEVRIAVLLARAGVKADSIRWVLRQLKRHSLDGSADLLWLPGDFTRANQVWVGTVAEFASELRNGVATAAEMGILIPVGRIVTQLRASTVR